MLLDIASGRKQYEFIVSKLDMIAYERPKLNFLVALFQPCVTMNLLFSVEFKLLSPVSLWAGACVCRVGTVRIN